MAKVHHRKARKDYPDNGITKGDMYYYVSMKTGPRSSRVMRSLTPFRRSQLTTSAFYGAMYDIEDALETVGDLEELNSIIEDLEALTEETQCSFDNMPESLQQGDTGMMLEERVQGCESASEELREIAQRMEDYEEYEEYDPSDDAEELSNRVAEGEDPEDVAAELAEEAMTGDTLDDMIQEARDICIDYP